MKHGAGRVLEEDAHARQLVAVDLLPFIVVFGILADLVVVERDVVVEVEVAAERRHPREAPAHAPLERFDLGKRPRDTAVNVVALRKVDDRAVEMIGEEEQLGQPSSSQGQA